MSADGVKGFKANGGFSAFKSKTDTSVNNTYKGGAYKDIDAPGLKKHHIPADSVSPYSRGKGPVISMDPTDHRLTASWGNKPTAKIFRAQQNDLIRTGRLLNAQQMDVDNVRNLFGNKYDSAIEELQTYTRSIIE